MDLEFRHLRIVIAVADEGSITKAAAALGLSQPSLTSQLQRIERAMGAPLFDRARTGVVPTSFGRVVLAKARSVVNEMADLRGEAHAAVPGTRPTEIRIGGYPGALLSALVPRVLALFADEHGPDSEPLTTQVHTDPSTAALFARVKAGRVDAAFVVNVIGFEAAPVEAVHQEVIVPVEPQFVALSERHPLAASAAIDLADLATEPWLIDPQEDHGAVSALRWACRRAGFEPRITHEVSDAAAARDFINTGQAVSLAHPTSTESRGLVVRPLVGDPLTGRIELAWKEPCPIRPALLHRAAAEAYETLVTRNASYARWWSEHGAPLS